MAGLYDLTQCAPPRTIGLTRHSKWASLHGNSLQSKTTRKLTPDVFASPEDSPGDEESNDRQVADDGVSDDSEFGASETQKKVLIHRVLGTATDPTSAMGAKDKRRELIVEPSNIRAGNFTSGLGPGRHNGSQSSQKRKDADVDDDDLPFSFSQSKRPRQSYGGASAQRGSVTKPAKKPPTQNDNGARPFREYNTNGMLARAGRLAAEESKRPGWRQSPAAQASQRDQRASQRSAKSTQESSQNSSKDFKQPPRPSPKKVPKFRASPVVYEESDPSRATRSSTMAGKPAPTDDNALKSSKFQNALSNATDKLGLRNKRIKLPPSATRESSIPSATLDLATTASSPLSSLDDSSLGSSQGAAVITSEDIPIYNAESRPAVCPMCKQPVERSELERFSKVDARMSLRQQTRFCKAHKERSAESEWAERGYPEIDWQGLDTRITRYHSLMDEMLSNRKFSFYRNVFEDSLRSGKNKTLQESLMGGEDIEGTSPGYYGGRGAKVMADNIMSRFASKIRRLAASDKLISSGGVSRYVQAVLVPELAILLIKDDMKVDEEQAREVLRDSVDIGNLLNEEEDEAITEPAAKETEVVDTM